MSHPHRTRELEKTRARAEAGELGSAAAAEALARSVASCELLRLAAEARTAEEAARADDAASRLDDATLDAACAEAQRDDAEARVAAAETEALAARRAGARARKDRVFAAAQVV